MNRTLACMLLGGALALVASYRLVVAQEEWAYPPAISLDELRERVTNASPEHPRLFVRDGELQQLRQSVSEDPVRRELAAAIVRQANRIRNEQPISYTGDGQLLRQSRLCVQRVLVLATAYYLTGDERFAARGQREMLAAARFQDWNPSHFLDVAEMTFALAVGYDWLYDQLEPDARTEIRKAIVEKGVSLGPSTGCLGARDNWGQVCNGGLTLGALAVLEDERELAAQTVNTTLRSVTRAMSAYAPAGGYPEGPVYWSYGTSYNVFLLAALDSVFGTDFGLSKAPGFDVTGQFPNLVTGPSGLMFNYADSRDRRSPQPAIYWLSARFGRPEWLLGERERLRQIAATLGREDAEGGLARFLPLALLWWRTPEEDIDNRMPLHWSSEGDSPIAVHRSGWDPRATYVAIKAGSPSMSHGQMDIGSFVLDTGGVRWAVDLGNEPYGPIEARGMGLWAFDQASDRWKIFRQSSLAHNTLVIDGQLQRAGGHATLAFSDDPSFPHSIIDMSSVYEGQAQSVRRGVALLPSGEVLFQDELSGLPPGSRVRWGMITRARAEKTETASMVLRQAEQRITLNMLMAEPPRWETSDTSKRVNDWDSPNPDTRMVAFTAVAPASGELTIAVLVAPGSGQAPSLAQPVLRPLADWGQPR